MSCKYCFTVLITSLILTLKADGQELYRFPQKVPGSYQFDPQDIYQEITAAKITGEKKRDVERYAEMVAYGKEDWFISGKVYFNWHELEDYLNDILGKLIPDSLKHKNIHAFPARSSSTNAFAIHDGSFFVNIGLVADIVNEASLAFVLGHEMGHFINQDSRNSFFNNLKVYSRKHRHDNYELRMDKAHGNRMQEHIADSIGFLLTSASGYDLDFAGSFFYQTLLEEQLETDKEDAPKTTRKRLRTVGSKKPKLEEESDRSLFRTHPEIKDRINFLEEFKSKHPDLNSQKKYLVGEQRFSDLQRLARLEVLGLLMDQVEYTKCVQRAFTFHLLDPDNNDYVYYILEATRRLLYLDHEINYKGFLTEDYSRFFKEGEGLLKDVGFLLRDSVKYQAIKATHFLDTTNILFNTYLEAFDYFSKLATERRITECYLTLALHNTNTDSLYKHYLSDYLQQRPVVYEKYAEAALKGELITALKDNPREMLIFDNLTFLEDHSYGYHNRLLISEQRFPAFMTSLADMISTYYPEKEFLPIDNLRNSDFQEFIDFRGQMVATTFYTSLKYVDDSKVDNEVYYFTSEDSTNDDDSIEVELFTLMPKTWNFLHDNKIRSIEFLKAKSLDERGSFGRGIIKFLFLLYPSFWAGTISIRGSDRYTFTIDRFHFDIETLEAHYYRQPVRYKMTKPHFINTIYHLLK